MMKRPDLDAAVAALSEETRFAARGEIARLDGYLEPGEQVGVLAGGSWSGDDGLLVATDKRLLFLNTMTGSYFTKHTTHASFAYEDVERIEFDGNAIAVTPRATTSPNAIQQLWRRLVQINEWLDDSTTRTSRWRGVRITSVPAQEAAALYDYVAAPGGPLAGRVLDRGDVKASAALAAEHRPAEPERWTVAVIATGTAIALAALVAFLIAASTYDLCQRQPNWLWAVLAGPVVAAVLVAAGSWGTRSVALRKNGRWAWVPVGAAAVLIWIGLPASC
jgi:hypothetical protein